MSVQLQKLEKQNVSSVITDLRSNGGGALTEAVSPPVYLFHPARLFRSVITTGKVREDSGIRRTGLL
ncbi:S41 family peptidase [Escherichia coli]|nr:S41 family peptidase [Escherichia coli]